MDREEILGKVPIFAGLNRRHLKRLSKLMVPRSFRAGDAIVQEKDQPAGFFVITSGEGGGGRGEFLGEMALFESQARSATVRAVEDTECLAMTAWDFRAELSTDAEIA